jgi:hypothetical protein
MMCGVSLILEEQETKETAWLFPYNGVPVIVSPGLRILSPIDKLAYPLNQSIK